MTTNITRQKASDRPAYARAPDAGQVMLSLGVDLTLGNTGDLADREFALDGFLVGHVASSERMHQ